MLLSLFVGFVLGAAALLFALQNTEAVALTFLGWQFESSLALLVLVAVAVGMLISILASLPSALGASFRIMGLKKENQKLAQEVETHRQAAAEAAAESVTVVDLRND
ncbi:MAG TPA: LapA family protein [Candidatus Paceibacterota bacterium]|nr:LapA family protein [Candidatus Paceibacterota bacterium]